MVKAFDIHKSASFKLRKMMEIIRNQPSGGASPLNGFSRGNVQGSTTTSAMSHLFKEGANKGKPNPSDADLMKEKFAKLALGEDIFGGGKGVSSALALSNAITNLAASVFGEQRKLEPMKPEMKQRWRKEVDWLLSVTDHIVELVPSQQQLPDGTFMEVMASRQRADLLVNIPALRKLDAMLMECLDNFKSQNEFWYVNPNDLDNESEKTNSQRNWWIPVVKVPINGLSETSRRCLQHQKESINQVLKSALAINAQILSEMEIPESYIETLPKNGKASLGDLMYRNITDDYFEPEQLLESMDLSSEHKVVDLKNRIEASIVIWKRKIVQKDGKSSWSSIVSMEKRELFEERAETILLILKHYFPGIPQSSLDISKIQHNQDVGLAVLESYSRVLESLASAVLCRIEDVLNADNLASNNKMSVERIHPEAATAGSVTLLDFMGWSSHHGDNPNKINSNDFHEDDNKKFMTKAPPIEAKRVSYLERLENWGGMRSPTARH